MFRRIVAYVAAVIAVTACGGASGDGSTGPITPPPPPTLLAVQIMGDASSVGTDGKITVSASITPTAPSSDKIAWKLNGKAIGQGISFTGTLNPGNNQLCVDVTGASGEVCKTFPFNPRIDCKLVVANSSNEALASPMHITFSKEGSVTVSRDVGLDGDCSMDTPLRLEDGVLATVDTLPGVVQTAYPRYMVTSQANLANGLTIVLRPTKWQIKGGSSNGIIVPMLPGEPLDTAGDGLSFWPTVKMPGGKTKYMTFGLTSKLPFQTLVLDKPEKISAQNIGAISTYLDSIRISTGWNVASPATAKDTTIESPNGFLKIIKDSLDANGKSLIGQREGFGITFKSGSSEVVGGTIWYVEDKWITLWTTEHEVVHVLGFNHTCRWLSVENQACVWIGVLKNGPAPTITATDVGYMQQMYRIYELETKYSTHSTIGGTYAKYAGLPAESVAP